VGAKGCVGTKDEESRVEKERERERKGERSRGEGGAPLS